MTLYGYLGTAITAIIGYLIVSFSWSIFISKKWGFSIMFLDMLKVTITMFIAFGISCININNVNLGWTSY